MKALVFVTVVYMAKFVFINILDGGYVMASEIGKGSFNIFN